MKELTTAQEEILQVLWDIEEGVVNDIIDRLPEPKPAYNTVSTVVRVLEKKGYADHKAVGKAHIYFPVISQEDYAKSKFSGLLKNHFGNSLHRLVSFFAKEDRIDIHELEEIRRLVEEEIRKQKKVKQ